jgi:hypothetical protein
MGSISLKKTPNPKRNRFKNENQIPEADEATGLAPCGRRDSMISMPFSDEMIRCLNSAESPSLIAQSASRRIKRRMPG